MEDVLFVAGTAAFFALALAYVRLCDRIIGADPVDVVERDPARAEVPQPAEVGR